MRTTSHTMRGFTLIEVLVSVAIFAVVMVMALGALLALSTSDRKAESLKSAINNLNFSLDSMSRAIRTGYNYKCTNKSVGSCSSGDTSLTLTTAGGPQVVYQLETSNGSLCGQGGAVGCVTRSVGGGAFAPITSSEVVIKSLTFYLLGDAVGSADNIQPRVIITLSGTVALSATQSTNFNLQTSVTQRLYDQ